MARSGKMKMKTKGPPKGRKGAGGGQTASFPHHLTMREAARNAEGRRNLWSGSQLRHRTVNFVRAEDVRPESDEREPTDTEAPRPSHPSTEQDVMETELPVDQEMPADAPEISIEPASENLAHAQPPNTVPQPLPTPGDSPGDSSEDEIVFHGRSNPGKTTRGQSQLSQMGSDFIPTPRYITEDEGRQESDGEGDTSPAAANTLQSSDTPAVSRSPIRPSASRDRSEDADFLSLNLSSAKRTRRPRREVRLDETDAMDDYIANMDSDYEDIIRSYNMNGVDTPESDTPYVSRISSPSPTRDMDALFETSPPSAGGYVLSDTEDKENSEGETGKRQFTKKEKFATSKILPHGDSTSGIMQEPDNAGPHQASDEDLLSESEAEEIDLDIDLDVLQSEAIEQSSKYFQKGGASQWWPFQSTSAGAMESDPLYDLDMLDFSKADLKNKSKKKQKKMAFELGLSDSDLELELEMAWQKDRGKKKARKHHREELRSQGLLGRGARKPDLGVKYSDGMDLDDFKAETKRFLLSSKNSLSLPPMKKDKRKLVHEVAGILSLKSQSRGNGPSRFTVLNKTGRTPSYTSKTIFQVEKIFSSGKFSRRIDRAWTQSVAPKPVKGTRGRKDNSASYTDGEVVGATAPEIGAGNKGRAMLEKMGWSMGTALGATNNKGILLPVAHVVKNSRAGLG